MWATLLRCPSAAACPQCHWLRPFGRVYGFVACSPRLDRSGGRYGSGGRGQRRRRWGHRTPLNPTILDRTVTHITVTDPQHCLCGKRLTVLRERSGRGSAYLVVALPDGRKRSIRIASTDLASTVTTSGAPDLPRISVRTLIPLMQHLSANLALLAEEVIRDGSSSPFRVALRLHRCRYRPAHPASFRWYFRAHGRTCRQRRRRRLPERLRS